MSSRIESLQVRLLLWYTALLALAIATSGALVCYASWRLHLTSIDAALAVRADTLAHALHPTPSGTFDLVMPPGLVAFSGGPSAPYYELWNTTGETIDRSDPDLDVPRPVVPGTRTRDGRRELAARAASGAMVVTGISLADARRDLWSLVGTVAGVGAAALTLSLAGGWWLVRRALAPVDRISRTARAMVDGDFAARIPIEKVETEFGQLASALNDAFDRLHASLEVQRRFTADASHELRTPLATVSTEVQWALARTRTPAEYLHSLEVVRRAALRMQAIVERLLALARAEVSADVDRRAPVPLADLVQDVVEDLTRLAESRQVSVVLRTRPAVVTGDVDRLRDALTNVIANAIQYSAETGRVDVSITSDAVTACITVTDAGPGIAPADLPRVFEPFFRADTARSRDAGGAGLGLTVARAIVLGHRGAVTCKSELGRGTTVVMQLPCPAVTPESVVRP